jgi:hypothetical protein
MISNCDKFKALVPIVNETDYSIDGRWNAPNFYLFNYDKSTKDMTIHILKIRKQYDKNRKLTVSADWTFKNYKTEKPALKALSTCIKTVKEFNNLLKIVQAHEDF